VSRRNENRPGYKRSKEVIEEAFKEARYRDPAHEKKWVVLLDGKKTQIRIVRNKCKNEGLKPTIIVDLIHVIEYLWKAGRGFHPISANLAADEPIHSVISESYDVKSLDSR
jgi:hypothetical protein